jgi:hypothetical protein
MTILVEFLPDSVGGRVSASSETVGSVWADVRDAVLHFDPDARLAGRSVETEWHLLLSAAGELAGIRRRTGEQFEYNEDARMRLARFGAEVAQVGAARGHAIAQLGAFEAAKRLRTRGFVKRELKDHQMADALKMASLANAATFSVPGAGKTTVAIAVHLLATEPGTRLLVVAPKNAFSAWDEVIEDCFDITHPDASPFVRLTKSADAIRDTLFAHEPPKHLLISYDQLIRSARYVTAFLSRYPVHVILDESHRIKAGGYSQRGQVALSLAPLAVRRDILSGTPIPNEITDVVPQIDFLWPGQALGARAATAPHPHDILSPLYVRTTKRQLGLGPVRRHYERIEMTAAQAALYGIVRDELLKVETGVRTRSNIDLDAASRSVMRLLQIASNPVLVVKRLTNEAPDRYFYDNEAVQAVFSRVFAEGDSPKITRAVQLARELAARGERSVIWSTFTENVERIAELLRPIGSDFIHGGVDTGSPDDPDSREGKIRRFHDASGGRMVLVANPAACSEGISLHRVCHNAIYVDRSFNAAHFLQSVDRIHRLGLPANVETHVHILESIAPQQLGSVDYSVRRRMVDKLRTMAAALNDPDLQRLMLDEDEPDAPLDWDIKIEDILDVINELRGEAAAPGEEDV